MNNASKFPTVSFIGIGNMGGPMARNLADKGFRVTVCNRTLAKAERWLKEGAGALAHAPSQCAHSDIVCICVGDEVEVNTILNGKDGLLSGATHPLLVIDHTTTSGTFASETAKKLAQSGHAFLDAPVSGGTVGAQKGVLTAMCGGTAEAFDRAGPVLAAYTKSAFHMGPSGSGQLTKMLNQICISATLRGIAEAIRLGKQSGLDLTKALAVLGQGAAQSWQLENRAPWIIEEKYKSGGFAVKLIAKDLDIVLREAEANGITLPITSMIKSQFDELNQGSSASWDFSAICNI